MDSEEIGIHEDEVAYALFEGVDFSNISQAMVLGSFLESPEDLMELVADNIFPMNRDQVLAFLFELQEDGLISEEYINKDIADGEYFREQVIDILITAFTRILNCQLRQ